MDGIRSYILSVAGAAILGSLAMALMPEKSCGKMLKIICSFVLLAAVCRISVDISEDLDVGAMAQYQWQAEQIRTETLAEVKKEQISIISQKTEAYIEDKAKALGGNVAAQVDLNEEMVPWEVKIRGEVSPYVKMQLTEAISCDLGIPKNRQEWCR